MSLVDDNYVVGQVDTTCLARVLMKQCVVRHHHYLQTNNHFLSYVDDVNLICDHIGTIKKVELLLNACKDIGLADNTWKTKYMQIGRHQGLITNEHIRI